MNGLRVLGPLEVVVEGVSRPLGGRRRRRLLSVLTLWANGVVSNDRLVDLVWGTDVEDGMLRSLRTEISRVRQSLDGVATVVAEGGGYRLEIDPDQLDVARFEALVTNEASRGGADVLAVLGEALGLWRGGPFAEIADSVEAAVAEGQRLEGLWMSAVVRRAEAQLAVAGADGAALGEVVGQLRALVEEHPLQERLWALLMLSLYRSGRQAEALAAFQQAREVLVEDLGLEPSGELVRLEQQILDHDPVLDPAVEEAAPMRGDMRDTETIRRPSGTVTFLFTDIEASTALWEDHPELMRTAVERHDEVLRASFDRNGGYVFTTAGDSFAVAFARVDEAIEGAVAAQKALAAELWPGPVDLAVRMGAHVGEAQERDADYFGPAVNRAARIMAAAHGGQILISGATARVARDGDSQVDLRELGTYRLKDVRAPEQLWQVVDPDLEREFPTPRVVRVVALPQRRPGFVGRLDEVQTLGALLGSGQIVTITGPGGVGKTRLAVEAGWEAAGGFEDGVWFCDLATTSEAAAVTRAVAAALDVPAQAGAGPVESIVTALASDRALVIVDNCEHVLDEAAKLVAAVVAGCPGVAVLATSRERLGIRGELVRPLAPLDVESDAVELFELRAVEADPSFELGPHREAVAELCRRLDGVPLAVELAAARARALGPAEMLDRMEHRFTLLRDGRRGVDERQRTLFATVEWSYRMLNVETQHVFDLLAIFSGSFDIDAIVAVAELAGVDDLEAMDLVENLVDKSLLNVERSGGRTRYRLLETLREYGERNLSERGELGTVRRSHAQHYARRARAAQQLYEGPGCTAGVQAFEEDWDNIKTAVSWALETDEPTTRRDLIEAPSRFARTAQHIELGDWALAATASGGDDEALYLGLAALFAIEAGEYGDAITLGERMIEVAISPTHPDTVHGHAAMSYALWHGGEVDRTIECHDRFEQAARAGNNLVDLAQCQGGRAVIAAALSPSQAPEHAAEGRRIAQQVQSPAVDAIIHLYSAAAEDIVGRHDSASEYWDQALAEAVESHNRHAESLILAWRSVRAPEQDRTRIYLQTLQRLETTRNWLSTWVCVESIAAHWAQQHPKLAAIILGYLDHNQIGHVGMRRRREELRKAVDTNPQGRMWLESGAQLARKELRDRVIEQLAHDAASENTRREAIAPTAHDRSGDLPQ